MTTAGADASKVTRNGDTVFKPVNAQGQGAQRSPAGVFTPPCTPPPAVWAPGGAAADALTVCDTPRLNKTPSENGLGAKRSFGFATSPSEGEAGGAEEESRSSRPSRQCREAAVKKMRTDAAADDDYSSDRTTPGREARRQAEPRPAPPAAPKAATPADTRSRGPCSYEYCPNPNHSSGGGFKVVSNETKAGNRDWSCYAGRTFCNACFTQYATRGTLQRPGRVCIPAAAAATASPHAEQLPALEAAAGVAWDPPAAPSQPARVWTRVEVEEGVGEGGAEPAVELELTCWGQNVEYQWLHDGRAIAGAVRPKLLIDNPRGVLGEITCRVRNAHGQVAPFKPVCLPLTVAEALERYSSPVPPPVSSYTLRCVCGLVRKGSAEELVVACECGLECCGTVDICYADGTKVRGQSLD